MKPLFEDTAPAVESRLIEGYRQMTPRQKLERVIAISRNYTGINWEMKCLAASGHILGVMKVRNTNLDRDYLEKTAIRTQVSELLKRAYADAGLYKTTLIY